jgi:hypothetical protein
MKATKLKETQSLMTENEIQEFGINIVLQHIQKEGFEILGVNVDMDKNPQIFARSNDDLAFITVRTALYPKTGTIEDGSLMKDLIANADKHGAICYFASVGILNADAKTEEEKGLPVREANFYILFDGLLVLTYRDRVKDFKECMESVKPELRVIH